MDPIIGKALIGAGTSLIGNLFGIGSQKSANKTNIQLQREQNAWNEKMWNMNNAYNAPVEQVKRLKDAGLNVGLMYANGADVGNSSAPAQGNNPAQVQPTQSPTVGVVDSFNQVFDRLLNQKVAQSNIELNAAKSLSALAQSDLFRKQGSKIVKEINELIPSIVNSNKADTLYKEAQAQFVQTQTDNYQHQVDVWKTQADLNDVQRRALDKMMDINYKLVASQIYKNYEEGKAAYRNSKSNEAMAYYTGRRTISQNETEKVLRDGYRQSNYIGKVFGFDSAQYQATEQFWRAINAQIDANAVDVGILGKGRAWLPGTTVGAYPNMSNAYVYKQADKSQKRYQLKQDFLHPKW